MPENQPEPFYIQSDELNELSRNMRVLETVEQIEEEPRRSPEEITAQVFCNVDAIQAARALRHAQRTGEEPKYPETLASSVEVSRGLVDKLTERLRLSHN